MRLPKFSVVIPAYNAERYLEQCLGSVAGQTLGDYELVIVDDGSIDSTPRILDDFLRAHELNSVVLRQDNQGRLSARRAGLGKACGEYAVFLDSDDCLRADALEVLARCIDRTDADVIGFGMSNELDFSSPYFSRGLPFGFFAGEEYRIAKRCVLQGRSNTLCGKAIRLAAFDRDIDYGRYAGLMHGEDLFQLLPVIDRARSYEHTPEALYFYRRHSGASTATYKPKQLDDVSTACGRLLEYGERWGMSKDAAYGALRNVLSTVKILVRDPAARSIRSTELDRAGAAIRGLGLDNCYSSVGLRPDDRVLVRALLSGYHGAAVAAVGVVELCKKVRR